LNDVVCGFGPDQRFWRLVIALDAIGDGVFQFSDTLEGSSANTPLGNVGEPAFDQIEPGGGSGNEVKVEAGMFFQPGFHLFFLSTTVVTNEQEAEAVVYESERSVPGIGDVFASQTRAEGDSGRASRCAARKRANAGFPVR
jgi:hypothetical protein